MKNFYADLRVIHADYVIFYIEFTPFRIFYIRIFVNFTWYCDYYAKFQNCKFFKEKHASFMLIFMQKQEAFSHRGDGTVMYYRNYIFFILK